MSDQEREYVEVAAEVARIVGDVRGILRKPLADRYQSLKSALGEKRCDELAAAVDRRI